MPDSIPTATDLGLDPEVATALLPHIDSFVKWEVLRFLHDNPETEANAEELARYVGRDEYEVRSAVRTLANANLVRQRDTAAGPLYGAAGDEPYLRMLKSLIEGFVDDHLIRLLVSSHILAANRRSRDRQYAIAI